MLTYNLDAERQVLGQILLAGEDPPDLSQEDFWLEQHKEIWQCLSEGRVTIPEISEKLSDKSYLKYLQEIIDKHLPTKHIDRYVEAIKRMTKVRKMFSILHTGIERMEAGQEADLLAADLSEALGGLKTTPMATLIGEWVDASEGTFTTTDLQREFGLRSRGEKQHLSNTLGRLVEKGKLVRNKARAGAYRIVDNSAEVIDFDNIETREVDLALPLGLSTIYKCRPKHIIVIAGEFNSGKTGLLLNVVKLNMDKEHWKDNIHYYNSEMGPSELKNRLQEFGRNINTWNASFYERAENFADVIKPNGLNLIDFLEADGSEGKEFWRVGAMITEIHNNLEDGVAVIAIQKNKGNPFGLGGQRGLEKPRLYVTLSGLRRERLADGEYKAHTATIEKVKESHIDKNMNGYTIHYTIGGGAIIKEHRHFENLPYWHEPPPEEEEERYGI